MTDYRLFLDSVRDTPLDNIRDPLRVEIDKSLDKKHGQFEQWQRIINEMPRLTASSIDLDADTIRIGDKDDCTAAMKQQLTRQYRLFHPWRKGPFSVFDVLIDAEWRSDFKWKRLSKHIQPLAGRRVLDVGCGNGYFCLRMHGAGASHVIGIDPMLLYVSQFQAVTRYTGDLPVFVLPLTLEQLPVNNLHAFDSVFSMGVLYHRRSPLEHITDLRHCLRDEGELILETLVIDEPDDTLLAPTGRYAKMRNVWFIPAPAVVESWLGKCGFGNIRLLDMSVTSPQEQRSTDWMTFESLRDFLDPVDNSRTIEGYPAPTRAIFIADAQ